MKKVHAFVVALLCLCAQAAQAQSIDSMGLPVKDIPQKYYAKVDNKISSVDEKLTKKSLKYLAKFQRQEAKLQRKMQKLNPELVIDSAKDKYNVLAQKIKSKTAPLSKIAGGEYNAYLDSLGTSLSFLKQFNGIGDKVKQPLASFNQLQDKLQETEKIKAFIAERKAQLKEMLSKYTKLPAGLKNQYNTLSKTVYYYSAQLSEYKEMLKDPGKIEGKALSILSQLPAYQDFMKEHSQLSSLFAIPASYADPQALQGLQTVDQVQQIIRGRIGSGASARQVLSSQMQAAQGALNSFKDKLNLLGGASGDIEMPDFVPQNQKTKTFFKRLVYGSNIQTTRASIFPTTTDIGGSIGYKWKNRVILGIGASYKIGWGNGIQHIHITSEGAGLRSYFDYKLKKTFSATGGWEYNYQEPFSSVQHLIRSDWTKSGLIGISKEIDVKSKMFRKTKVQLLWDFLSYYQAIRTPALVFRVGYDF